MSRSSVIKDSIHNHHRIYIFLLFIISILINLSSGYRSIQSIKAGSFYVLGKFLNQIIFAFSCLGVRI